jgi:hypothetical protein
LPWHITIKVTMVLRFSFDAGASIAELVTSDSSYWVLKARSANNKWLVDSPLTN